MANQKISELAEMNAFEIARDDVLPIVDRSTATTMKIRIADLASYVQSRGSVNNIGTPGAAGFGVGICPSPPAGFTPMSGYSDPLSDNYGNYQYSDGSVMCYIPAFYYKVGTGSNGLALNVIDVKPFSAYSSVSEASAAGYALPRGFYNGGAIRLGVFVDKYLCSNNNGVASSLKNGIVLSSAQRGTLSTAVFSALNGAPSNSFAGAVAAAKTRGSGFFCQTVFINKMLALLATAHGSASTSTAHCAWYSGGSTNYPKGCNNNALGDTNDATLAWVSDGNGTYNCGRTGSANFIAKTAHNGQVCGVVDLNGLVWEITPGLTMDSSDPAVGKLYVLKTSANIATLTAGTTLATDLRGASGLVANYDDLGIMASFTGYALNFSDRTLSMGSASQVLSGATSGTGWQMTAAGIPLVAGGSNQFGNDYLGDYSTNDMCPLGGGDWSGGSRAGVWALGLANYFGSASYTCGFRSALYL